MLAKNHLVLVRASSLTSFLCWWSKLTWFHCEGSTLILFQCRGRIWLGFGVGVENDLVFVFRSNLKWFWYGDRNWLVFGAGYGETRMTKLSLRPASLRYPGESATLEARRHKLRDVNYSPRRTPRRRSNTEEVRDVPSNKEQHPVYPKIHIPSGNPGMYPGCPLTTTGNRNWLGFCVGVENDLFLVLGSKVTSFMWGTELDSISV